MTPPRTTRSTTDRSTVEVSRRVVLGAAAAVGWFGGAATASAHDGRVNRLRIPSSRISVQLYTLRTLLEQDLDGTLAALADIGFRKVELAGTYGRGAAEFRSILDRHGLVATSSHVGIDGDVDTLIADALTLGHTYVVVPYVNLPTIEGWRAFAGRLEEAGKACRSAGLSLGYHNHAHEFQHIDGQRPFDVLAEHTSPHHVHFEVDLYWAVDGGVDPVDVVYANYGRVRQFHVKDRAPDGSWADLGTGTIDFRRIFRSTWDAGIREYIVEHDQPADPLRTAAIGYQYLTNLRF
jgi:sugar phosphate isomerase/epimerase